MSAGTSNETRAACCALLSAACAAEAGAAIRAIAPAAVSVNRHDLDPTAHPTSSNGKFVNRYYALTKVRFPAAEKFFVFAARLQLRARGAAACAFSWPRPRAVRGSSKLAALCSLALAAIRRIGRRQIVQAEDLK